MAFFLKKYQNFAKKEENIHESSRKLSFNLIFESIIIYVSLLLKKGTKSPYSRGFFCGNYQRNDEKNHETSVFLSYYFSMFLKNMAIRLL